MTRLRLNFPGSLAWAASTRKVAKVDLEDPITPCRFGGRLIIIIPFNNLSVGSISVKTENRMTGSRTRPGAGLYL